MNQNYSSNGTISKIWSVCLSYYEPSILWLSEVRYIILVHKVLTFYIL